MTGNDRNWYGDGQYAGHGTGGTDQPTHDAGRHLVSVPDRRHGNHGPPERVRDAVDGGAVDVQFGVVGCTRVEHDAHA